MIRTLSYNISDIIDFINWTYFFHAWGFAMKYSAIANIHHCNACVKSWINSFPEESERKCAAEASELYNDSLKLLSEFNGRYKSYARFGIFEANSNDDDIIIYESHGKSHVLPCLRQQYDAEADTCLCLADYIRPKAQNIKDHIGIFAATVDKDFEKRYANDAYKHMLCQTLADRIAEATTELMHLQVRRTYWGYAKNERLTMQEIFAEKFQGIRPAIGYPSLPDQSIIFIIDNIIDLSEIGIKLTDNGAMSPHASTCGLMFAHPKAKYFSVGKISEEQADDYALRRKLPKEDIYKYLQSNLQK